MEDVLTVYKIDANFVYGLFFKKKKKSYSCLKESVLLEVCPGEAGRRRHFVAEAGYAEGVPAVL